MYKYFFNRKVAFLKESDAVVLFPGGLLPLRIFEPRYLRMVSECLREQRPFAVAAIREGPEAGGEFESYRQSEGLQLYRARADELVGRNLAYPCFCSRRDIAAAASATVRPAWPRSQT